MCSHIFGAPESKLYNLLFLFPFLSFPFLSYNHLHYLRFPIQGMMISLIMHSRFIFIFLFLLHRAIANQELPLFGTNNLFLPASDLLPVTTVASMASTSTAASEFASQAVEIRDDNEKYVHHQKREEAPFPMKSRLPTSSYRLIFNDGVLDSVPNDGSLISGYADLLRRAGRGNDLEIDTMGVVRIGKQLGLSAFVDAVSAPPETIRPDDGDLTQNARRYLGRRCDYYVYYPGANGRRDLYHRSHSPPTPTGPREDSNRIGCRVAVETEDECPMLPSDNQMSHRPPLAQHKCLRENALSLPVGFETRGEENDPAFGPPRNSDQQIAPLLPRNVIQGVSSVEIVGDGVYKLQRGDDGAIRSVLVKRLDANLGIHPGLGRPLRSVEISHDREVCVVDAAGPIKGIEEVEVRPVDPIMAQEEALLILRKLLPPSTVSTVDGFEPEAVGSLDSHNVLETSDGWGGGPHSSELERSDLKKLIQPDPSLGVIGPTGEGEGTLRPDAGVSISSPLMVDQNGRVYHQITQAHSEDRAHIFNLPGPVLPTGIQSISTDEIGQLLSKDSGDEENDCLPNRSGRTASGSVLALTSCAVQEGIDGKPYLWCPKRPIGGSDYLLPPVEGNPAQLVPDLVQAMDGNEEAPVGAGGGAGASGATNMTLLFNSMTVDKLAVLLPIVMFGTLLLVLVIFGVTFCCLRQAEETYYINIRARHGNRDSRRRRKNNTSIGAAEEGDIMVPPRASGDQVEVGGTKNGWFLQRWYNSLGGDAAPKRVSFSSAEVIPHRNPRSNLGWAKGIDGGRDTRDPSYVLDAVSDRLRQTQGRPRSLSTIRSDGGLGSLATAGAVLATGRGSSEDASPNATMMSRRMHGAKGDVSTNFRQEFMSTIETTGLSGNPSSDVTLTHSSGELEP